jgi:DNA-binding transcriptional ArsR family regulator
MAANVNNPRTLGKGEMRLDMIPFGIIPVTIPKGIMKGDALNGKLATTAGAGTAGSRNPTRADPQHAFRALADPTRRDILGLLRAQEMTIAEVAGNFDMTRAAVKKHLTVLSDGGLITVRPRGRERVNALNPHGLAPVLDWLQVFDAFWDDRLASLKDAIERDDT